MDVPLCLTHWDITPSSVIDNITLSGTWSPKLIFNWHDFLFVSKINSSSLQVPSVISLSYLQTFRIKRMLAKQYCAYVIVTQFGYLLPTEIKSFIQHPAV